MFTKDDETAHLLRESTRLKTEHDMAAAIACLVRAKERMLVSEVTYPIETWCKLARYLRDAGRYDEAIGELNWLLEDLPRRLSREYHVDDPSVSYGFGSTKAQKLKAVKASMVHPKRYIKSQIAAVKARMPRRPRRLDASC